MIPEQLVFVVYDSIDNSVFVSQVLEPLRSLAQQYAQKPLLISFEEHTNLTNLHLLADDVDYIILSKKKFWTRRSLTRGIRQLQPTLASLPSYKLIARGPLAGYISYYAALSTRCINMTIQARGLLADEYRYVHKCAPLLVRPLHALRAHQYELVERIAYRLPCNIAIPVTIEAVSRALRDYLIKKYRSPAQHIIIAHDDIPPHIPERQRLAWRTATRQSLGIEEDHYVYCYNGSAKPWQCPEQTINFFCKKYTENSKNFFLIVTPDTTFFSQMLIKTELPPSCYNVIHVPQTQLFQYLAACDTGILFREEHIINWISRPTKVLDYQSVGLPIMHNNTVALLVDAELKK
jgi:hypothetical protein